MNLAPDLPPPVREARSFAAREVQVKFNKQRREHKQPEGRKGGEKLLSLFPSPSPQSHELGGRLRRRMGRLVKKNKGFSGRTAKEGAGGAVGVL